MKPKNKKEKIKEIKKQIEENKKMAWGHKGYYNPTLDLELHEKLKELKKK